MAFPLVQWVWFTSTQAIFDGTTNFTSSKTKKNIKKFANHHYIKNGFLVDHYIEIDKDHYYENQNIEKNVKRTSKVSVLSDFHI